MTGAASTPVEREIEVPNSLGLHVRPSTSLAETAGKYRARVQVIKEGVAVNAKSSIDLLTLAAVKGTLLTVRAEGTDARDAVDAVVELIASGFGEE
ncbi:MAG: HPr family phosphocarrier protein [Planctomycetota bacterium]|jgi:phosphocarrier protein